MGLLRTIPPTKLPVSLGEAKAQLAIDPGVGEHDVHLMRLIQAATERSEQFTGRAWLSQTWLLVFDCFPRWHFYLPRPPCQEVSQITYTDTAGAEQTLDPELYRVATRSHPARVVAAHGQSWPATLQEVEAVEVTYVAGYGDDAEDVPELARQAILLTVNEWFVHRGEMNLPDAARRLLSELKTGAYPGTYRLSS